MSLPLPQPDVDLSVTEVRDRHARGEIELVDVREEYEFSAGRIADARHVPLDLLTVTAEVLDSPRPLVFYCRVGARSAHAAHAFRQAGYDAWSMTGGLREWTRAGLPLVPNGGRVADH